jgi:site-specific DNA-methyltransferase (adenine-specific)
MREVIHGILEEEMPKLNCTLDAIFIDFPYGTTKAKWDTPVDLDIFWKEAKRLLKPNGVVIATAQIPFSYTLANSNLKDLRYEWIWEKTSATGALNAKKMPMKAHENVLIFYKKLPTYNPIKTTGHKRKVSTAAHKRNSKKTELYGDHELTGYDSTERYPRSVLVFPKDTQKSKLQSTQKPLALVEYFIKTYTNEGDLVGDFCAGSGTTGEACERLNRNYVLVEKEGYNIDIIKDRLSKYE